MACCDLRSGSKTFHSKTATGRQERQGLASMLVGLASALQALLPCALEFQGGVVLVRSRRS